MNCKYVKLIIVIWFIKDILVGFFNDIFFFEELVYLKWYMMNELFNYKVE